MEESRGVLVSFCQHRTNSSPPEKRTSVEEFPTSFYTCGQVCKGILLIDDYCGRPQALWAVVIPEQVALGYIRKKTLQSSK